MMRYISLFSGIEAASVAWRPLGWEPVAFCEIDPFPSAVLAYRFPDVPNLGDITKVDWKEALNGCGAVDVVVGGSPCQSFSIAGGRESLDGESRLMFEYIRAIREIRPRWFIWENVPGVFSTKDDAFGQLLDELEELGYSSLAWRTLDAQFFGVAQRRRRVFLVGHAGGMVGAAAAVLFERDSVSGNTKPSRAKREELARTAQISTRERGALAFNTMQITSADNGARPAFGDPSATLDTCGQMHVAYGFKFNQEAGAGSIGYETEQSPTITADWHNPAVLALQTDHLSQNGTNVSVDITKTLDVASAVPVIRMATAQANAEILSDVSPTVVAGQEHPIVCMTGDTGNAAVDTDLCGTLHVGGGFAADSVGPLQARDFKGVGNQYVDEGKVICQRKGPR